MGQYLGVISNVLAIGLGLVNFYDYKYNEGSKLNLLAMMFSIVYLTNSGIGNKHDIHTFNVMMYGMITFMSMLVSGMTLL